MISNVNEKSKIYMHMKIIGLVIIGLLLSVGSAASVYTCLEQSFTGACKTQLYACTNDPQCSYQLHENTHHIFLSPDSQTFPPLYFSNALARTLYTCLKTQCQLPQIDEGYPRTLPFADCLIEVYDICRGNLQQVFQKSSSSADSPCYRKYCNFPSLSQS